MKLELYFSEEEMREYLAKHWWLSMTFESHELAQFTLDVIPLEVELWWKAGVKPDFEKLRDKTRSALHEHSLQYVFLKEMKAQLLKL